MDRYLERAVIAPSARKHGISDEDMLHALKHQLFGIATEDPEIIIYVGASRTAEPLEIGVLDDGDVPYGDTCDVRPIEIFERNVELMSSREERLAEKLAAFEKWAEEVDPADLKFIDTSPLKLVARLAEQRDHTEQELAQAVAAAREDGWSWAMIGFMLGVSRQAAQQKYGAHAAELAQSQ